MTKGSQFWYLCLLLILKVTKNSIFKGGTLTIKKIVKILGFSFQFLFLYIPLLDKYKLFFYKSTQKMDLLGRKMKKIIQFFFPLFSLIQMTSIWKFLIKIRIDIKIGNLWPYKNPHSRSKYPIVLLQECCEKIQFKSGYPVSVCEN